jgi:SAM-dependent methyltransferase
LFLAVEKVGKAGKVIGVDMTPEMISLARKNAAEGNCTNVEFSLGEIENLPVADNTIDVMISNCVINLSPFHSIPYAWNTASQMPGQTRERHAQFPDSLRTKKTLGFDLFLLLAFYIIFIRDHFVYFSNSPSNPIQVLSSTY